MTAAGGAGWWARVRCRAARWTRPGAGWAVPPGVAGAAVAAGFTPAEIALGARVIATRAGVVAVWAVTGWPSDAVPGWLDPLLSWPGRLDVSMHLDPVDPTTAAGMLRRRLARLEATRRHDDQHERLPDPTVAAAAEDAAELAARVARGQTRLVRVGLYLAVHAEHPDALADEVAGVRALAASLLLDIRPATWRQWPGWRSCVPTGVDELTTGRVMDTTAAGSLFPFSSPDLPTTSTSTSTGGGGGVGDPVSAAPPDGPVLGLTATGIACYDRFAPDRDNHNAVILGRSGAGKSYAIKVELLRQLYRGVHALIIDPEDEYTTMTRALGGTVLRLGAPGVSLNPLDLPVGDPAAGTGGGVDAGAEEPAGDGDALATRAGFLAVVVGLMTGRELDDDARAVLDDALGATYAGAGITADPATWYRPAPTLVELSDHLSAAGGAGALLARRLRPFTHGSHAPLFARPTTTPPAGALTSFSLRALPEVARPVATLLALEHAWRVISTPPARPRLIVIDEAWLLMAAPEAAAYLARFAKAGRKRWAGLTFASQDVGDVLNSPLGLAVIANSATTLLFRQHPANLARLAAACRLSGGDVAYLRHAPRGAALLRTDTEHGTASIALRVVASADEDQWIRSDPAGLEPHAPDPAAPGPAAPGPAAAGPVMVAGPARPPWETHPATGERGLGRRPNLGGQLAAAERDEW